MLLTWTHLYVHVFMHALIVLILNGKNETYNSSIQPFDMKIKYNRLFKFINLKFLPSTKSGIDCYGNLGFRQLTGMMGLNTPSRWVISFSFPLFFSFPFSLWYCLSACFVAHNKVCVFLLKCIKWIRI